MKENENIQNAATLETPETEEKNLVITNGHETQALAKDDFFDSIATRRMWYNADPADKLAGLAVVAAIDDTDYKIMDCIGQVIEVVNVVAHETTVETEDKGVITAIRTVLIDKEGKSYGAVADGVRDSVANLFALVGLPPYNEPIKLTPIQKTTRKGYRTLKLIPKF